MKYLAFIFFVVAAFNSLAYSSLEGEPKLKAITCDQFVVHRNGQFQPYVIFGDVPSSCNILSTAKLIANYCNSADKLTPSAIHSCKERSSRNLKNRIQYTWLVQEKPDDLKAKEE